jgi:hypothetical protein
VSVHRFLVTAPADRKMDLWIATGAVANWLEGRPNGDRETWLVTVFDSHGPAFLDAARQIGVTVEEIEGGGETEAYILRVGEPGTGWQAATASGGATP